jgi:hypothetical protein
VAQGDLQLHRQRAKREVFQDRLFEEGRMDMKYKTYKTTLGHKYQMRICEDELHERRIFRAVLVLSPLVMVFAFALAAGVI